MFCPVCNGILPLSVKCSTCDGTNEDWGRITDWTGPYAPYESLDATNELYNQLAGATNCRHIVFCSTCKLTAQIEVAEWS